MPVPRPQNGLSMHLPKGLSELSIIFKPAITRVMAQC